MRINKRVLICVVCCVAVGGSWLLAQSQANTSSQSSLGNLARHLKEERAEAVRKPSKVFTNDNLPARPGGKRGLTVAAAMSSEVRTDEREQPEAESTASQTPEAEEAEAKTPSSETAATTETESEASDAHDEAWYRAQAASIRTQLDLHQRQLSVLEQKLSQNQMQFYDDPNKTLQQEFSRKDISNLSQDLEKKKQEIAADEQALSDLRDQLRREGSPSGWLR